MDLPFLPKDFKWLWDGAGPLAEAAALDSLPPEVRQARSIYKSVSRLKHDIEDGDPLSAALTVARWAGAPAEYLRFARVGQALIEAGSPLDVISALSSFAPPPYGMAWSLVRSAIDTQPAITEEMRRVDRERSWINSASGHQVVLRLLQLRRVELAGEFVVNSVGQSEYSYTQQQVRWKGYMPPPRYWTLPIDHVIAVSSAIVTGHRDVLTGSSLGVAYPVFSTYEEFYAAYVAAHANTISMTYNGGMSSRDLMGMPQAQQVPIDLLHPTLQAALAEVTARNRAEQDRFEAALTKRSCDVRRGEFDPTHLGTYWSTDYRGQIYGSEGYFSAPMRFYTRPRTVRWRFIDGLDALRSSRDADTRLVCHQDDGGPRDGDDESQLLVSTRLPYPYNRRARGRSASG